MSTRCDVPLPTPPFDVDDDDGHQWRCACDRHVENDGTVIVVCVCVPRNEPGNDACACSGAACECH